MELYTQAIRIDSLSYSSVYNMTLLAAQNKDYGYNILMKNLIWVPEAEDTWAAKDKIYEWVAEIGK